VILVSTGTIVAIVVAVIVVAILVIALMVAMRRRRLQQRFGPEYDRLVGERDSKLKAEAELSERQRRVQKLDIRPLTPSARASYADQWAGIQQRFVDAPADAVAASQVLVVAVMSERGYPAEHHDQMLADLSVEHAQTLDHYRAAEKISATAAAGTAATEDLRQAMIHYRALFRDLLGEPADVAQPDAPDVAQADAADVAQADAADVAQADAADVAQADAADLAQADAADVAQGEPADVAQGDPADIAAGGPKAAASAIGEPDRDEPDDAVGGTAMTGVLRDDDAPSADGELAGTQRPLAADESIADERTGIPAQRTPRS
jgi:hypothetical protein